MSDFAREKHQHKDKVKFYQDRLDEITEDVNSLESQVLQQKLRAEAAAERASEVCEEIVTTRSHTSIQSEISKLKHYINQELPQLSEREEIEERYLEAMEHFEKTNNAILNLEKAMKVSLTSIN